MDEDEIGVMVHITQDGIATELHDFRGSTADESQPSVTVASPPPDVDKHVDVDVDVDAVDQKHIKKRTGKTPTKTTNTTQADDGFSTVIRRWIVDIILEQDDEGSLQTAFHLLDGRLTKQLIVDLLCEAVQHGACGCIRFMTPWTGPQTLDFGPAEWAGVRQGVLLAISMSSASGHGNNSNNDSRAVSVNNAILRVLDIPWMGWCKHMPSLLHESVETHNFRLAADLVKKGYMEGTDFGNVLNTLWDMLEDRRRPVDKKQRRAISDIFDAILRLLKDCKDETLLCCEEYENGQDFDDDYDEDEDEDDVDYNEEDDDEYDEDEDDVDYDEDEDDVDYNEEDDVDYNEEDDVDYNEEDDVVDYQEDEDVDDVEEDGSKAPMLDSTTNATPKAGRRMSPHMFDIWAHASSSSAIQVTTNGKSNNTNNNTTTNGKSSTLWVIYKLLTRAALLIVPSIFKPKHSPSSSQTVNNTGRRGKHEGREHREEHPDRNGLRRRSATPYS
jgi:hypothetical protein